MNLRPNDHREADDLDRFWDELVLGQNAPQAGTPDEEMVMSLQNTLALDDSSAEQRLRRLVFGSTPEPALAAPIPMPRRPAARPAPIRPGWSIRNYASFAAAALAVLLVGAVVAAQNAGFFDRGGSSTPTVIPAAIAQLDATPAALASPTVANDAVVWSLPFAGTNVEIGATALANGTLYRLIRSDQFTGVQAVDTATGTETWRSEQAWDGNGLGADANGVYLPTGERVVALDPANGEQRWQSEPIVTSQSLAIGNGHAYLWDGRTTLAAFDLSDGSTAWKGVATVDTTTTGARASQPPVATELGIAAVSGAGTVALFDTSGNAIGTSGTFDPNAVALAATSDGKVLVAGATADSTQPWSHDLLLIDPSSGSTEWERTYYESNVALAVVGDAAFILAGRNGLGGSGEVIGSDAAQLSSLGSRVWGIDLATGDLLSSATGDGSVWVSDEGTPPYVALGAGPNGPIAVSAAGTMSYFTDQNPLVQAIVTLPGVIASQITAGDTATYVSLDNGTLFALAPTLASIESEPVSSGSVDWTAPLDGQLIDFGGMAYGNGLVFRLIDAGSGPQIEATYAATGQPAWSLPFAWSTAQLVADPGPNPYDPAQTWTGSGNIFAVDTDNRLIAIDGVDASLAWQHAFAAPVVSLVYSADTLYVWDESGTMTALLPQDGTLLWATTPGTATGPQSSALGMPIPAFTGTTIAMVDADGVLHAISKETGDLLWSTPGFDGTNTRLTRQGNAQWDQTEVFVVASAQREPDANGVLQQSLTGVLASTGERIWDSALQGPLVQPVDTDETLVVVTGDQLMTGKNVPTDSTPIVDGESFDHYLWTGSGEPAPAGGGTRLFALDAATGGIVWIRTSAAGGFTGVDTKFPEGGGSLYAVTSDGLLVSPNRGNGALDGAPTDLGGPVLAMVASGETEAIGSFATLANGALVAFGGTPFNQQG